MSVASAPAPASAAPTKGSTSSIYETFVGPADDELDLIALVSYSLYKRDKLAFIEHYRDAHGRDPSQAELSAFIVSGTLPTRIKAYNDEATAVLQIFSEAVLTSASDEVEERCQKKFDEELRKVRPFWRTLGENVLANVGALVLGAILLVVVYASRLDPAKVVGEALGYDIRSHEPTPSQHTPPPKESAPSSR